jgi:hypothetical protein
MANEPDDSNVVPGDGPGEGYVKPLGIAILAVYLLVLTLGIIRQLCVLWPSCDPNAQASSANTSGSAAANKSTDKAAGSEQASGSAAGGKNAGVGAAGSKAGAPGPSTAPAANTNAAPADTTTGSTPSPASPGKGDVKIASVSPNSGDVAGSTQVQITGKGFLNDPTVTFGGSPAIDPKTKSASLIAAKTPAHAEGATDVVVTNADGTTDTLKAGYTYSSCTGLCRSQLLVLVLLAGALGACFHALRSLWMFVGNRSLKQSWVLMYLVLPLNGAALAFIFFLLINAGSGFFAQPKDSNSCFWIIGIAALVGLFSQQAAEKLKKIADSVFTTVPPKADSLQAAISVTSIEPAQGPLIGVTRVTITGGGFTKQSTVAFGEAAGMNLRFVSSSSIVVDAPPGPANHPGPVDVTVTDTGTKAKAVKAGGFTYQ